MKTKIFLLPGLIIALACPQSVMASDKTIRLDPSSKWAVRYEDDSCLLMRRFGEDKNKVMIVLSRFGPGPGFRMTIAGNPVKAVRKIRPMKLQFGGFEQEQKVDFSLGKLGEMPAAIAHEELYISPHDRPKKRSRANWREEYTYVSEPDISAERYAAADYVTVRMPLKKPVILNTGSLGKPFEALDKCVADLLTYWGIDVEKHKTRTRAVFPANNPGKWIKSGDYPAEMLRMGQPALVNFRVSVDVTGTPTACHIQQTTRPTEFDDAVCANIMRRARFEPALDADGVPIESYWRNAVRFAIPQ